MTLKDALLNLEKINFFDGLEVVLKKIRTNFEQKVFKFYFRAKRQNIAVHLSIYLNFSFIIQNHDWN